MNTDPAKMSDEELADALHRHQNSLSESINPQLFQYVAEAARRLRARTQPTPSARALAKECAHAVYSHVWNDSHGVFWEEMKPSVRSILESLIAPHLAGSEDTLAGYASYPDSKEVVSAAFARELERETARLIHENAMKSARINQLEEERNYAESTLHTVLHGSEPGGVRYLVDRNDALTIEFATTLAELRTQLAAIVAQQKAAP